MNLFLVYNLLLAHVLADFYCQNDESCNKKRKSGFRSWHLYKHSFIVLIVSAILCWDVKMFIPAVIIAFSHLIVDGFKSMAEIKISKDGGRSKYALFILVLDQLIHLAVILFSVNYFGKNWEEFSFIYSLSPRVLAAFLAALILAKPGNILVNLLFKMYTIQTSTSGNIDEDETSERNIFHSGKIIGTLERWLILLLVLLSQYEAIGFLVAAKSILRFSETSKGTEKSEYVLVGTLFSFLIALLVGIIILILF